MYPVRQILDYYFVDVLKDNKSNKNVYCKCPLHESSGKTPLNFSINRHNGKWKCFAKEKGKPKCGGGKFIRFIQLMEKKLTGIDCSREHALEILANFQREQISWAQIIKNIPDVSEEDSDGPLPVFEWPRTLEPIPKNHPWPKTRRYKIRDLRPFCVSYDRTRPDYVFFPVNFGKKLRGFTARDIRAQPYLGKWDHQPGLPRNRILFNFDRAMGSPYVIICEGPLDVIRLSTFGLKAAVALFGAMASDEHLSLILENWSNVLIALDNDEAGNDGAMDMIKELSSEVECITRIVFPEGKDADDMKTVQEFLQCVKDSPMIVNRKRAASDWGSLLKEW